MNQEIVEPPMGTTAERRIVVEAAGQAPEKRWVIVTRGIKRDYDMGGEVVRALRGVDIAIGRNAEEIAYDNGRGNQGYDGTGVGSDGKIEYRLVALRDFGYRAGLRIDANQRRAQPNAAARQRQRRATLARLAPPARTPPPTSPAPAEGTSGSATTARDRASPI